jgi:hypothetical protein
MMRRMLGPLEVDGGVTRLSNPAGESVPQANNEATSRNAAVRGMLMELPVSTHEY